MPTHFKFICKLGIDVFSYLAYQGAYSHVMVIYAFCNVDNVSWGTKGNKGKRVSGYLIEKVSFIANWYLVFNLGYLRMQFWLLFSCILIFSCLEIQKKG